jgi:hypothetical protein
MCQLLHSLGLLLLLLLLLFVFPLQVELLAPPRLLGEYCLMADEVPELCYRPATLRWGHAVLQCVMLCMQL